MASGSQSGRTSVANTQGKNHMISRAENYRALASSLVLTTSTFSLITSKQPSTQTTKSNTLDAKTKFPKLILKASIIRRGLVAQGLQQLSSAAAPRLRISSPPGPAYPHNNSKSPIVSLYPCILASTPYLDVNVQNISVIGRRTQKKCSSHWLRTH